MDPEVGLPGRLEASFGGDKFGQRSLEAYLVLGMKEHGFLERALGFRDMKLRDDASGAAPQAMPHQVVGPSSFPPSLCPMYGHHHRDFQTWALYRRHLQGNQC